jgi:hypothetical protein
MGKNKAKDEQVVVGFCLDETGSMTRVEEQTVTGANAYLDELGGGAVVTLTLFSAAPNEPTFRTHADAAPAAKVERFSLGTSYRPRGNTPLYDAIGNTIRLLDAAEVDGVPVLCVVQTDGHENASTDYTLDRVRKLIAKREKRGWRFVYLGADQTATEAEQQSASLGLVEGASVAYRGASADSAFRAAAAMTTNYASDPSQTSAKLASAVRAEYDENEKKGAKAKR